MNKILDRELELEADGDLDYNEDAEIPQEILLPKTLVSTFSYEVAKMKANVLLNEVFFLMFLNNIYFFQVEFLAQMF